MSIVKVKTNSKLWMTALVALSVMNISSFMADSLSDRDLASEDSEIVNSDSITCNTSGLNTDQTNVASGNRSEVQCDAYSAGSGERLVTGTFTITRQERYFKLITQAEADCEYCENGKMEDMNTRQISLADIGQIEVFAKQQFNASRKKVLSNIDKEKTKKMRIELCKVDEEGNAWKKDEESSALERERQCLIDKTATADADLQAKLWKRLQPMMLKEINTNDMGKIQQVISDLSPLTGEVEGATELSKYAETRLAILIAEAKMEKCVAKGDERCVQQVQMGLERLNADADRYFEGRANIAQYNMRQPENKNASALYNQIQGYQSSIDASLSEVVSAHKTNVNSTQGVSLPGNQVNDGSSAGRGTVFNRDNSGQNYNGAPKMGQPVGNNGMSYNGNNNGMPMVPGMQQQQQQNFNRPMINQQQNFSSPMINQPMMNQQQRIGQPAIPLNRQQSPFMNNQAPCQGTVGAQATPCRM